MPAWFIITSEYPPVSGGVSDYTRQVARALASAGDAVQVWTPCSGRPFASDPGVNVHELPDRFGLGTFRTLARALDGQAVSPTILLQYVPQGFGMRVMNLPFLSWLARRPEPLWLMVHEAVFPFKHGQPLRHHVLAVVTRAMLGLIGSRADRVFVSVPAWRAYLERYARLRCRPECMPVPSNVDARPSVSRAEARANLGVAESEHLLVHFGSYGDVVVAPLRVAAPELLRREANRRLLLLGRNGDRFARELIATHPFLDGRLLPLGESSPQEIADAFQAADLGVFPFPDGVSGRRGSVMAALAQGVPVLTTDGPLTEPFWRESSGVQLAPVWDAEALAGAVQALLEDDQRRQALACEGQRLYADYCALDRTIASLRRPHASP